MELGYRPAMSTERLRVGTPPILQQTVLHEALKVWDGVDMADLRAASMRLCDLFIAEVEARCPQLALASPRDASQRGSQVSFAFEYGYAVVQALIERGVIGDFRAPNIMRFGFTPLYIDHDDVIEAAKILQDVLEAGAWQEDKYQTRSRVM